MRKQIAVGGAGVLVVCMVVSGVMLGIHAWSPTPIWDQWQEVTPEQLGDLLKPHNEHRIAVTRLIAWADIALAQATGFISLAFVYIFSAAHCSLLVFLVWLTWPRATLVQLGTANALIAALFFSGFQYENFASGFQNQFTGVFFLASAAIVMLCLATDRRGWPRSAFIAGSAVTAAVGCATMANGLLIAPLLAIIAFLLRLRFSACVMAALAAGMAVLYFIGLPLSLPVSVSTSATLVNPIEFFGNVLAYLGGPFANSVAVLNIATAYRITVAQGGGAVLIVGVVLLLTQALKARRERRHLYLAWSGICIFVLASAAVTALGRKDVGGDAMLTSRYGAGVAVVWSAVLVNFIMSAKGRCCRVSLVLSWATCIWLASVQLLWTGATQGYKIHRIDAEEALLVDVEAEAAFLAVYHSATEMRQVAQLLRADGLAMYSEPWRQLYRRTISQASKSCVPADVLDVSRFESPTAFVWRVSVVGNDMPRGTRALAVSDMEGVVVGLLIRGGKEDLNATLFGADDAPPRWSGYIHLVNPSVRTLELQAVNVSGQAICRFQQQIHMITSDSTPS